MTRSRSGRPSGDIYHRFCADMLCDAIETAKLAPAGESGRLGAQLKRMGMGKRKNGESKPPEYQRLRTKYVRAVAADRARAWFSGRKSVVPFVLACDVVGLDADAVRERLASDGLLETPSVPATDLLAAWKSWRAGA